MKLRNLKTLFSVGSSRLLSWVLHTGQLMLGTLINRLIMSGQSAEVGKAATDSNFRNKLYKEYDIKPEDFL